MESPVGMEKRLSDLLGPSQRSPSRKCKKRRDPRKSHVHSCLLNMCPTSQRTDGDGGLVSGMEYPPRLLWQSGVPPNVQQQVSNGQRLFAAMSDPSVCGYSPMPLPYVQPITVPPMYNVYQPVTVPDPVKTFFARHRRDRARVPNVYPGANNNVNDCGGQRRNGLEHLAAVHVSHHNGDYASLPPNADSGINGDELGSEQRRYSDPGLGPATTSAHSDSEDSLDSGSSITTIGRNNKLVLSLIEQITDLKRDNSQLFKELNVTKTNLESLTTKLAQCKHCTSDYQPGMLSDFIREIREANKKCEEGLVTKVKALFEEKQNQQAKEIEEFKNRLSVLLKEKEESGKRITKLEEELTTLKLNISNGGREIAAFEEETLALRRELQEARSSRNLAEDRAAKCVNLAVSRSVTPVTFETPCITSTPVRTALAETRSLIPVILPVTSSHTPVASPVRRPYSAEVAAAAATAALLVPETTRHCESDSDSRLVRRENSPRPTESENEWCSATMTSTLCASTVARVNGDAGNPIGAASRNKIWNPSTKTDVTEKFRSLSALVELYNHVGLFKDSWEDMRHEAGDTADESSVSRDKAESKERSTADILEEQTDDLSDGNVGTKITITEENDDEIFILSGILEEQQGLSGSERLCDVSYEKQESRDHASWQSSPESCNQRDDAEKSRWQTGSNSRRLCSETDKPEKCDSHQDDVSVDATTASSSLNADDRSATNENDDDRASRAIAEVPDVAVVGGSSFLPKDLCSTRILTSRVLTASSRATYTTAYI